MAEQHVCELHSGIDNRVTNLEKSDDKQWTAIDKIQNRLPVWGTIIISVLTFIIGLVASFALKK